MSTAAVAVPGSPATSGLVPEGYLFRLSVAQYHEMIRAGIFQDGDPVELVDGYLVLKMTKNPAHCLTVGLTADALNLLVPAGWHVRVQDPVTTEISEPEPDVALVKGQRRDFSGRHPGPGEIVVAIEVADTTLAWDRGRKKSAYARAGIAVYWIVNILESQVEVFTQPTGETDLPTYREERTYKSGMEVPVVIEGREIGLVPVRDLLP
jgi:Uma2 family endonuclease